MMMLMMMMMMMSRPKRNEAAEPLNHNEAAGPLSHDRSGRAAANTLTAPWRTRTGHSWLDHQHASVGLMCPHLR